MYGKSATFLKEDFMKKFIFAGLLVSIFIAALALTGCASGPQTGSSQKNVTITGISPEFNGKYATVGLKDNNAAAAVSLPNQISGNSVTVNLFDAAAGNPPFTKDGDYSVFLMISETINISPDNIIWTGGIKANISGSNTAISFSSLQQID